MRCCSALNALRRSTTHLLLRLALAATASCWLVPSFRIVGGGTVLNKDVKALKKKITSSVYDCTVEDVEYSSHLVVVITLP